MFVKGQKVNLPKHNCIGTVNYVCENEICIKCTGFNVWCDKDGYLPHTNIKLIETIDKFIPGQQAYAIGTINGKKVAIVGNIVDKSDNGMYKFKPFLSKDYLNIAEDNLIEIEKMKFK